MMEEKMSSALKLSLKEMALRKLAVNLWNEDDILAAVEDFQCKLDCDLDYTTSTEFLHRSNQFQDYATAWQNDLERKVRNKALKLDLPESQKQQLISLIRPIGTDILRWKMFHEYYFKQNEYLSMEVLKHLHWTCAGAIDYQKTAKELIDLKMLDSEKRYRLACHYCFVEYIPPLWNELDEENRFKFGNFPSDFEDLQLEYVWPYILKGEEAIMKEYVDKNLWYSDKSSFNVHFFEFEACAGNKAGVEYFLQRLTDDEKESALIKTVNGIVSSNGYTPWKYPPNIKQGRLGDVLCFLWPMLSPDQQMQILDVHDFLVLNCFLDWPWHDVFSDATNIIFDFLPVYRHVGFYMIFRGCRYYFPNLIRKVFQQGPRTTIEDFMFHEFHFCTIGDFGPCFFTKFFDDEDTEMIKEIFRNASAEMRIKVVSGYQFLVHFFTLMEQSKWHLIELCLHETLKSNEDKLMLKKSYEKLLEELPYLRTVDWKRFFELLDTVITTSNKRSLDGENAVEIKILKTKECSKKK